MARLPASMDGTVISVHDSGGIPAEKSILGSTRGRTTMVAAQFTRAKAAWLDPRSIRKPATHSVVMPAPWISRIARAVKPAVTSSRGPR